MSATPNPRTDLDLSLFGDEHIRRYEETDGEVGYLWNGAPCAILTTTGRKSGARRKSALIFGQDGDTYLLVGSQGGAPKHPMWYLNLRDNPDVELQVKGDKFAGRARLATDDEKPRLWKIMLEHWPYYDDYQARTERDIPLVVIERGLMGRLENKVAIVTGAGRGIGYAYAERFLREGASVVVAEIDADTGKHAAEALAELGPAEFVATDVTSVDSVEACVQAVVDRFGGLDILMNNAALYGDWDMGDQSYEYLKKVVDVNQHSVWLMSHAAAPKMVEGGGGRIINQASGAAYNYVSPFRPEAFNGMGTFNYQIAKWGVVGLTKFMAGSLGTWGITVNCIAPGVIDTEATRKAVPGAIIEQLAKQQAVPGVLDADDLTGAAVFFASDEARFVTGQVLVIDGGKHMPA